MTELEIDYAKKVEQLEAEISELKYLLRTANCPWGNQFICSTCTDFCYHYKQLPEKFKEE
jgi:hypothetical protein